MHISQLRAEGRVTTVSDVVTRGQRVRIKVLSVAGQKVFSSLGLIILIIYRKIGLGIAFIERC